uniref:Ion transport domain-containing protein n=1 Tax=Knipowitschia caucasica TaxID=637954 RepID=A0AAV2L4E6_KNICA
MWLCLGTSNQFVCVVFYVTLLIVGNFLILTLFVTLLMKWINNKLAPNDEETMQTLKKRVMEVLKVCGIETGAEEKADNAETVEGKDNVDMTSVTPDQSEGNGTHSSTLPIGEAQKFHEIKNAEDSQEVLEDCFCPKCYSMCRVLDLDTSQGCGRVWSNLRQSSFNIVQHPYFNNFIFFIVLVSSTALVCEDTNLPALPKLKKFLGHLDQVITYLFVLEVLFKWIGLGFKKYFSNGFCWLDFIVTLACVLSVAAQTSELGPALISLKALRPLRILAHIKGTRLCVSVLLRMLPSLLDVLLVTSTVWLFFAIICVQLFAGTFEHCFNKTSNERFFAGDVANRSECYVIMEANQTEVEWRSVPVNFDNIWSAQLALFSMGTLKGWLEIIYLVSDSKRIEDQPEFESNVYMYNFFVYFLLFGGFFCCVHILKVLLEAYSSQTQKIRGSHLFLTKEQQKKFNNITFCPKRSLAPCPRPQGRVRGRLYDLLSCERFEWVMQVFIFAGTVLLMVDSLEKTWQEERVWSYFVLTLMLIFFLESFLKICAFSRSYFKDNLNTIDFVLVVFSLFGIFIAELLSFYFFSVNSLHLLRLARVSRIIHRIPGTMRLRHLIAAWKKSLPALFNLSLVLFVLIFTYASFGTFFFSHIKYNTSRNFETFGNSLIFMLTTVTWAGWDMMLYPKENPGAEFQPQNGNAVAFCVSFLCLTSYVVLLMLLVLLVDMLNIFGEMTYDPLSAPSLTHFFKNWKKFDPESTHLIQRSQLPDLCDKLRKPLKISKPSDLDLSPEDPVHCRDVLLALSVQALEDSGDREALRARIDEKYLEFMPNGPSQENSCTLQMNQEEAAHTI